MLRSRDSAFSLMRRDAPTRAFDSVEVETTGIPCVATTTRSEPRRRVSSSANRAKAARRAPDAVTVGRCLRVVRARGSARRGRHRARRLRRGRSGPMASSSTRWGGRAGLTETGASLARRAMARDRGRTALAVLAAVTVRTRDARADETRANHRAVIRRMFSRFLGHGTRASSPPPSRVRERSIDRASRRALVARHRRTNRRTNMSLNNTRTSADRSCPLLPTWATIADASSPSRRRFRLRLARRRAPTRAR